MKPEEYTMFRLSSPYGYYPPAVEQAIEQYESALAELNNKYAEQKQISLNYQQRIERLQDELREMHLQMSSLELPEAEEAIEHFVLNDFKNYNSQSNSNFTPPQGIMTNDIEERNHSEEDEEEAMDIFNLNENNNNSQKNETKNTNSVFKILT